MDGHETILQFLIEGAVVYEILEEIQRSPGQSLEVYREDIFAKICNLFTLCNQILTYFCRDYPRNQKILLPYLDNIMRNKFLNFGQIDLLQEVVGPGVRLNSGQQEKIITYLFDMVKLHGKCPQFLEPLVELTLESS